MTAAEDAKKAAKEAREAAEEAREAARKARKEKQLWLDVSKVRLEQDKVFIQVSADKNDRPEWWELGKDAMGSEKSQSVYNLIARGLDKTEQTVIARLAPEGGDEIVCKSIRIQAK